MKNIKLLLFIGMFSMISTGCFPTVTPANSQRPTAFPSRIQLATKEPTPIVTMPTEPVKITAIKDAASVAAIPECPNKNVNKSLTSDFGIPGTIVYQKDLQGLYTVGGYPLSYSRLPVNENRKYFVFGISPDGKWLAFSPIQETSDEFVFNTPTIILLSATGEKIENTVSVESFTAELSTGYHFIGFSNFSHWINNNTIYAALYASNMTSDSPGRLEGLPKVIDPFSGEWKEDLLNNLPTNARSHTKGVSPDMTRMLYMDVDGLFLRDLEKDIDIWHDQNLFAAYGEIMLWSPDSETVAYANLHEAPEYSTVVLISRDGNVVPIVESNSSLSEFRTKDLRWSPDGRYLALLTWNNTEKKDSVFIYDYQAQRYVSRCPIGASTDITSKLIWSPDNKYIAYGAADYPLTIMDIQSGDIIELSDKGNAVGWSDQFHVTVP